MNDFLLKLGKFGFHVMRLWVILRSLFCLVSQTMFWKEKGVLLPPYSQMEAEVQVHHLASIVSCSSIKRSLLFLSGGLTVVKVYDSPQNYTNTTPAKSRRYCSLCQRVKVKVFHIVSAETTVAGEC